MTELVFVHGVSNRPGEQYDQFVATRDQLLRDILFDGGPLTVTSAMWGRLVEPLAWGGAVFPKGADRVGTLSLGIGAPIASIPLPNASALASAASADGEAFLDGLFAELVEQAEREQRALSPRELEQFKAATAFVAEGKQFVPNADARVESGR